MVAPGAFAERVKLKGLRGLSIECLPAMGPTSVQGFMLIGCADITLRGFVIDRGEDRYHAVMILRSKNIVLKDLYVIGDDVASKGLKTDKASSGIVVE